MKKIFAVIVLLVLAAAVCNAAEEGATKAAEPVGAVIEATGVFVGTVSSVVTEGVTGGQVKGSILVSSETGETKLFPVDDTVKIVDAAFNIVTLNQLKKGEKVEVQYTKAPDGAEKVSSVKMVQ